MMAALLFLALMVMAAPKAGATPSSALASETYVAVSSPAEVETVDSTTGSEVGTPVSLGAAPVAMAEYAPPGTSQPELIVAESGGAVQEVNPSAETVSTISGTVSATPAGVTVVRVQPTIAYALVLLPADDEVEVIDATTAAYVGTVSLGLSGTAESSITGSGANNDAYVPDPSTHQVVTLSYKSSSPYWQVDATYTGSSGFAPEYMAISPSGTKAYTSDGDGVDVSTLSSGAFAAPSSTVSTTYAAGALALTPLGVTLYVQMTGEDEVAAITTATSSVNYMMTGVSAGPLALSTDGANLSVPAASGSTLDILSTVTGTVTNTFTLDGTAAAIVPAAEFTEDEEAYVTEYAEGDVALVDLDTGVLDQTVGVGTDPIAVATSPDGSYAYVANYGSNSVSVLQADNMDTENSVVTTTISLPSGSEPDAVAVTPDGNRALVVDKGTGEVSVIDTNPADGSSYRTVVATIYLDGSGTSSSTLLPSAIAISPNGSYAYVPESGAGEITVLDLSGTDTYSYDTNTTGLGFFGEPQDIAVAPNDQVAYVTDAPSSGSGYLWSFPIDPENGLFQTTDDSYATVGTTPAQVSLLPGGRTAYVSDEGSDQISTVAISPGSSSPLPLSLSVTNSSTTGTPYGVGVAPDASRFLYTTNGSNGTLEVDSASTGSNDQNVNLGSSSDPMGFAVSPMFNTPGFGTPAGYGAGNAAVAATSSMAVVEGVDTLTGAFSFTSDDLSLPDIGIGLDMNQTYDSADASTGGPLGYGWFFPYGASLSQVPYGDPGQCDITITQGDGTPVTFAPSSVSGSCPTTGYYPPTFEQASLSRVSSCNGSDPCDVMTLDGNDRYFFDATNGELVKIEDPNSNTVTLAYSSGKLSSVTAESGYRYLDFTWSGSNISEVEDSAGRTATFAYSSGNLVSVTLSASSTDDPNSHEWAFSYNSSYSSHELTDWWSPDNEAAYAGNTAEATQVAYNSNGQVTSVTEPDWLTSCTYGSGSCAPEYTFSYPMMNTTTGTGVAVVTDPNFNYDVSADINDGDGNQTLYYYVDGVLMQTVSGYGYLEDTTSPYDAYPATSAITSSMPDPFTWQPVDSLDADGNLTQTSYDAYGNTISVTDPLGNVTSWAYNSFNEPVQEVDARGNIWSWTYDSHGNELTATDGDGDVTSYAYNSHGEQCAMLNADGYAAGFTLTACPTSSEPFVTTYGYDAEGDQISTTVYDGANDGSSSTVSETYVTTELYNAAGEECASLSADGYAAGDSLPSSCPTSGAAYETVNTAWDVFGNVLSSISPTNAPGGTTTYSYDADGNELTVTSPGPGSSTEVTTSTYDPDGHLCWSEPLSVSGPSCASPPTGAGTETTTYAYDPDGNEVSSVAPDGNANTSLSCLYETSSTFDDLGQMLSTTTPSGGTSCSNETTSTTSYTYDPDGNQITTSVGGITTTSTYNSDGELCWSEPAAVSSPSCASPPTGSGTETTTYTYNADGEQTKEIPPDGNASANPSNYATTTTYDGDGNVLTETQPPDSGSGSGKTTSYSYDPDGNELTVTDPNGKETTYSYDEQDRQLSTTDANGDETTYSYDADGSLLTETSPSSTTATDTYNGAGEVIEVSYTDGTPTVSYQYNSAGQVCWMYQGGASTNSCSSPPSGAATYSYDSSGRLVSETNAAGATVTYGYDAGSNLACVSYPNSSGNTCSSSGTPTGVVRYSYNQLNQLTSLTDWAGDTLTFTYNGNGQVCWVSTYAPSTPSCSSPPSASGAVTTDYSYDSLGNVSNIETTTGTGATNLLEVQVGSRDADDNILSETPTVGTNTMATDDYGYDQSDEVDSGPITGSSGNTNYAYTNKGSISEDTTAFESAAYKASGALCWTYSGSSSNGCSSPPSGATTYTYNSDGQRTAMTPTGNTVDPASYGWETESGLLTCVNTGGTSCSTSSPTSTTSVYAYDGDGLLSSATINSATTEFTWGTIAGAPTLLSDGTWDYVYANGGAPIEQIATSGSSPTTDLLLADESGNVRGLVQLSSGTHQDQLVNYTDYDAYGNPITESGGSAETGGLTTPQTGINSNYVGSTPWGFGEGYTENANGLVYLVHRWYDPTTAQFMSVDPDLSMTEQPYEYAGDNPVTNDDPSGQRTCCGPPPPPPCKGGAGQPAPGDTTSLTRVEEVTCAAYDAGFRGLNLVNAVTIAGAESGWNYWAEGTYDGTTYYGLWQLNLVEETLTYEQNTTNNELLKVCKTILTNGKNTTNGWENISLNAECAYGVRMYAQTNKYPSIWWFWCDLAICPNPNNASTSIPYRTTINKGPINICDVAQKYLPSNIHPEDCYKIALYAAQKENIPDL